MRMAAQQDLIEERFIDAVDTLQRSIDDLRLTTMRAKRPFSLVKTGTYGDVSSIEPGRAP